MIVPMLVTVSGWVAVDVSVDDDWQLGDDVPEDALRSALASPGAWSDCLLEPDTVEGSLDEAATI